MRRRDAGITLVEISAGVLMLGIVLALLIPVFARSARVTKVLECQDHLHQMYVARAKVPPALPQEVGGAYWNRLVETTPPQLSIAILHCPLADFPNAPALSYLGPSEDLGKYEAKDPIGSDWVSNHSDNGREGGNVLMKSGEVLTDRSGLWSTAVRGGQKCRP